MDFQLSFDIEMKFSPSPMHADKGVEFLLCVWEGNLLLLHPEKSWREKSVKFPRNWSLFCRFFLILFPRDIAEVKNLNPRI